ncbi:MAG TPA: helix-turn-helix domain-containing protein [Candidatus Paenibacillus intestinavium]|nr:helix-turn-helix domain-containing protein [Candidatus Paenibacillus intestinavium]
MNTGERMKKRRKELGFSAEYIASKLSVSRSTIFRYEAGDIEKMPVDILIPLSEVLQTTPAYFMGWDEQDEQKENTSLITKHEQTLLSQYRKLDSKGKHTVNTVLEMEYNRCTTSAQELRAAHIDDTSDEQMDLLKQDLDEL